MREKISISTCFNYDIPVSEQLRMISDVGFTHVSFGNNVEHLDLFKETSNIKQLLSKYNLKVDTIHGCSSDQEDSILLLKKYAKAAFELGAKVVVIHPCQFYITKDMIEVKLNKLLEVCNVLKDIAIEYKVQFAIENLHPDAATDVVEKALDVLESRYFGLCYDTSHAQIDGPREFPLLPKYADRIIAVHISDRIKEFVDHVVPGEGFIDFNIFTTYLKDCNYSSAILMEVSNLHTTYKTDRKFLQQTYNSAMKIHNSLL